MALFDVDVEALDQAYDNDDEIVVDNTPGIDPNQPVAYLDQINVAPTSTAY